jgi:RNA polymerase sigma-70 factor (ECF subfamily)
MSDFSPDDGSSLTDGVRRGDQQAFRQLFDQLYVPVRRYAASLVRDDATAEDVVQEAFVRLWDRRERLDDATPPRAWLYRTVRNLALNLRRDAATRQRLLSDPMVADTAAVPRPFTAPDAEVTGRDLEVRLTALIEALPPRQREALLLSRVEGLSHAEVAVAMDCAPRTVSNHLVAALTTLRRRLAEAGTMVAAMLWWVS